jgi:hypothetical protein
LAALEKEAAAKTRGEESVAQKKIRRQSFFTLPADERIVCVL